MSNIGRFSCGKFRAFYRSLKSGNLVTIAKNMLPSITMLSYANRSEKIRPFTI